MALCLPHKCGIIALIRSEARSNETNGSTKSMWTKSERDDMRKIRSHVTWNRCRCLRRRCACSIIKSFCPILDISTSFPQHEERCALPCCDITRLINTFVARTISCHIHGCRRRCRRCFNIAQSCSKLWNVSWILCSASFFFLFISNQKTKTWTASERWLEMKRVCIGDVFYFHSATTEWSLINHRQIVTHLSPCWCVPPVGKFVPKTQSWLVVTLLKIHW